MSDALKDVADRKQAQVQATGAPQADPTATQKAEALIDAQVRQIVGVVVRGILVSTVGIPPDAVCRSVARVTASILADAVRADLALMLKHRAGIKDAFKAGIDAAPIPKMEAPANRG